MPNYLGTQSNLTGIPSLLLSGLQGVEDPVVQTALYQIQNWANSFFPWQFGNVSGTYATGGVTVDFPAPFATETDGIAFGFFGGISQGAVQTLTTSGFKIILYGPTGTQVSNGSSYLFSYIVKGH